MRVKPLVERRAMLAEVLIDAPHGIELSEHLTGDGEAILRHACATGLERIVAKRIDSRYASGRWNAWRKIKRTVMDHFAVSGFESAGMRGVASLKVARLDEEMQALVPAGWVGSGISAEASRELRRALDAGRYVVATVEYRGWTPSGELRHPVFKGWVAE